MKRVKSNDDLPCIPFEWYINKDFVKNNLIYYCKDCKVTRRLGYLDMMKYKLIKRLGGEM